MDDEKIFLELKRGGKSIANALRSCDIDEHICIEADTIYKKIITSNLEYFGKDLIFRGTKFMMFMYWCCYTAISKMPGDHEGILDSLMHKFNLNKGHLQKIPSLFSKINLNCNLDIPNRSAASYFKTYIIRINGFSEEIKETILFEHSPENKMYIENCKRNNVPCELPVNIKGFNFNEDIVRKLVLFSRFIMKYNAEIKSSLPRTAYGGIFAYFMTKIIGIIIPHKYLETITGNSYATDSKNIVFITKTLEEHNDRFIRFYQRCLE